MPVLLLILVGLSWYAYTTKIGFASGGDSHVCRLPALPSLSSAPAAEVWPAFWGINFGQGFGSGVVSNPMIAWTDVPAHGGRLASGGMASGYEVRWWSRWNDHQVADVLIFRSPTDAARYVEVAGSTRCREGASTYRAAQVPGAREILWRNPVGALQADVFFARGRRAYRISEVPPGGNVSDIETADQWLFPVAEAIACKLRDAHCRSTG